MAAREKPREKTSLFSASKKKSAKPDELPADYDVTKYGEVNVRFIKATKNLKDAASRWVETCDWRAENHMDELLFQAQPAFAYVKRCYPHYIHRKARNGMYCYYERPGLADFPEIITSSEFSLADVMRHYCFMSEYLWNILEPGPEAKMVSVWDVAGVKVSDISGGDFSQRTRTLMKQLMTTMQRHYPERSGALIILNAPSWFTSIWRLISPHIDVKTKKKITILGKEYHEKLFELVAPENVPKELGGTDSASFGESPEEIALYEYVAKLSGSVAPAPQSIGDPRINVTLCETVHDCEMNGDGDTVDTREMNGDGATIDDREMNGDGETVDNREMNGDDERNGKTFFVDSGTGSEVSNVEARPKETTLMNGESD